MQSAFLFEWYYSARARDGRTRILPLSGTTFVSPLNANLIRNLSNGTLKRANESEWLPKGFVRLIVGCNCSATIYIGISIFIPFHPFFPAASRRSMESRSFNRARHLIPRVIVFENFSFRITLSRESRTNRIAAINPWQHSRISQNTKEKLSF